MKNLTLDVALTIIEEALISTYTIDEDVFSDVCAANDLDYNETHKYFESRGYDFI